MSRSSIGLSAELTAYLVDHSSPLDAVQRSLIEVTGELGEVAGMQIAPEQGAFMTMVTRLTQARRAIEVGTFTGYSALSIARGLPPDGQLLCCDVSEEWTSIARRHWERSGLSDRIDLRLGPALDTLQALPADPPFDLAFIDADKVNYASYYQELMRVVRPGGLIMVDNVLWSGRVLDPDEGDTDTRAIAAFNDMVAGDDRVETVMLPVGDGLSLIRVR